MKERFLLSLLMLLLIISCNQKKTTMDESERSEVTDSLGRYLYLANNGILHSRKSCFKMIIDKDEHGHDIVGYQFIDTMTVYDLECLYCPACFNDIKYEHFKQIQRRNLNVSKLFEVLKDGGADVGNFDEFASYFYKRNRKGMPGSKYIYDYLKKINAITSSDYRTFLNSLEGMNPDLPDSSERL